MKEAVTRRTPRQGAERHRRMTTPICSGTSPPSTDDPSIHHREPGRTKVPPPNSGDSKTSPDLAHDQTCAPPDDPQTPDEDEALRQLSHEEPELAEEVRRVIAWARDMDAP